MEDVISDVVYTFKSETVEWVGFQSFLIKRASDRTSSLAWARLYKTNASRNRNTGQCPASPSQRGRV